MAESLGSELRREQKKGAAGFAGNGSGGARGRQWDEVGGKWGKMWAEKLTGVIRQACVRAAGGGGGGWCGEGSGEVVGRVHPWGEREGRSGLSEYVKTSLGTSAYAPFFAWSKPHRTPFSTGETPVLLIVQRLLLNMHKESMRKKKPCRGAHERLGVGCAPPRGVSPCVLSLRRLSCPRQLAGNGEFEDDSPQIGT